MYRLFYVQEAIWQVTIYVVFNLGSLVDTLILSLSYSKKTKILVTETLLLRLWISCVNSDRTSVFPPNGGLRGQASTTTLPIRLDSESVRWMTCWNLVKLYEAGKKKTSLETWGVIFYSHHGDIYRHYGDVSELSAVTVQLQVSALAELRNDAQHWGGGDWE